MNYLQVGQPLDRYIIEAVIGTGGMGTVYRVRHQALQSLFAIKVLDPRLAGDATFVRRFNLEAQTAAHLQHPNIVRVFDVGHQGDLHYLVMELLDGTPLDRWLREHARATFTETANIISQVAAALDHAHSNHLIHRDIKPANIMLRGDGHVTLMDFGLARAGDGIGLTLPHQIIGTPEYISPEQAQGDRADKRSDIYALGIVAYKLLTGTTPFAGNTSIEVVRMHIFQPPPPLRTRCADVPPQLEPVLARVLAKRPNQRFQTAGDFARQLREAVGIAGKTPPQVTPPQVTPQVTPSRQTVFLSTAIWMVAILLLFVTVVLIIVFVITGRLPAVSIDPGLSNFWGSVVR